MRTSMPCINTLSGRTEADLYEMGSLATPDIDRHQSRVEAIRSGAKMAGCLYGGPCPGRTPVSELRFQPPPPGSDRRAVFHDLCGLLSDVHAASRDFLLVRTGLYAAISRRGAGEDPSFLSAGAC